MNNDRSTRFRTTHDRELSPVTPILEISRRFHGDLRSWERGMLRYAVMLVMMMVMGVTGAWGKTDCYSANACQKGAVPLCTVYTTKSDMVKSTDVVTAGETKLPTPTIEVLETPNGDNKNIIFNISPTIDGVTYKYTLDGTDPSESNGTEASSILLGSPAIVKVIATHPDYITSDVASSTSYVIPTNVPVLLQQKECIAFFMTQAKVVTTNGTNYKRLTTTNIPSDDIVWHFEDATDGYFIVKNTTPDNEYLCYNTTDKVFYLKSNPENSEKTKFVINDYIAADGLNYFNFQIKGQNLYVHRDGGNGNTNYIITTGNGGKYYNKTLWRIPALPTNKADMISLVHPLSFKTSNTTNAYYYRLKNYSDPTYYITAPANPATEYVKGGTVTSDNTTVWYLKEADDAAPITPYYYVVNAATGLYMYFSGTAGSNNAVQIKEYDPSNADSYKFIVVQAAKSGDLTPLGYFDFIPKALQNQVNQESNGIGLHDTKTNPLKTLGSRNTKAQWMFVTAPLFCDKPAFDEETGNITMSCNTYSSVIHYTTDGTTPDASTPTIFTNETELSVNDTYLIKAIAVIRNDDQTASSEAITLFNKPNVTLLDEDSNPVDENTYTYEKTAHEPTVSKVAIAIGGTEYEAPTSPTVSYVIYGYENNTNAGTATVNLVDNDDTDNIFFGNFFKDFTINKAPLTITPEDGQSKGYLDSDPLLTYTASGLLTGDELTGTLSRTEGESVGTYAISQGTLNNANNTNYNINFTEGKNFTITAKSIGSGTYTPASGISVNITKTDNGDDTYSFTPSISHNGTALTVGAGNDYTVSTTGGASAKYYIVTFTGANNYTGSVMAKFVNVDFHANSDNSEWTSSFVIGSSEGAFATPTTGYSAYIVTGANGNAVTTQSLSYIPEGVPVILLAEASSNGFMAQPTSGDAPDVTGNKLAVSTGASFTAGQIYILYNGEFVLNASGILAAGKVYLPKSAIASGSAPSRLTINWGEPSGIDDNSQFSILNSQFPTAWYTLDGRRLSGRPTKKGLYLMNGQKVIVR